MESEPNEYPESNNLQTEPQIQTENLQTEQSEISEAISSFSKQEFDKWLRLSTTLMITFFLLILWQRSYFNLEICLIPSIVSDFYTITICLLNLKTIRESYEKRIIFKELLENLGTFATKILIVVYLVCRSFRLSLTLVPLAIFTLTNLLIKSVSFNKCQIFSEILFIMMRIVRLLTVISIFLKIDGLYNFDWSLTFWPIWSFASIIGIIIVGLVLFSTELYSSSAQKLKILGSVYLIISLSSSLISFTLFFISLSQDSPNFYPPLFFLVIFVLVTFILKNVLQAGLIKFLTDDSENDTNQVLPLTQNEDAEHKSKLISALYNPPKFLVKLSSSYFKEVPILSRQSKKRTSSVIMLTNDRIFHHRSMTSEKYVRKLTGNLLVGRLAKSSENKLECIEAEKCITCMEKYSNAVIMKCGHGGICFECACKMFEEVGNCHICRGKIDLVVRILQYPDGVHEVITESD